MALTKFWSRGLTSRRIRKELHCEIIVSSSRLGRCEISIRPVPNLRPSVIILRITGKETASCVPSRAEGINVCASSMTARKGGIVPVRLARRSKSVSSVMAAIEHCVIWSYPPRYRMDTCPGRIIASGVLNGFGNGVKGSVFSLVLLRICSLDKRILSNFPCTILRERLTAPTLGLQLPDNPFGALSHAKSEVICFSSVWIYSSALWPSVAAFRS